jgi:hypothetical protein
MNVPTPSITTPPPKPLVSRETAVFFNEVPVTIQDWEWLYWIRVDPAEIESGFFAKLVLNRAIRDRGGLPRDKPVTAYVYIRELNSTTSYRTEFTVTRQ